MPLYGFACECGYSTGEFFPMADVPTRPRTCHGCGRRTLKRVYEDLSYAKTSKSVRTFGQQAELNARRLGRDGVERLVRADEAARRAARAAGKRVVAERTGWTPVDSPSDTGGE